LINGLSTKSWQRSCVSWLAQNAEASVDRIFEQFPLEISNAANYEKCVPRKDEQLLYWTILKCLSENL
jgi:hypothetical protein